MASILTRTKQGVLDIYNEVHKCPVCAIYEGNRQLICIVDETPKKRFAALENFLTVMEQSGTTASFDLKCYEATNKNGKVNSADPHIAFLPFKVNDSEAAVQMGLQKNGALPANNTMMELMDAKLKLIQMQFDHALEKKEEEILRLQQQAIDDDSDDDDYDDDRLGQVLGTIGSVGEKHPWMQDIIKNLGGTLTNILRGAQTKFTSMTEQPMAVNGVNAAPKPAADQSLDEKLKWANLTLVSSYRAKHGIKTDPATGKIIEGTQEQMEAADTEYVHDMVKLAEVASTKPKTFNNAIEALREL